ncbi:MAG TPA: NAD(P)-dependent oxidoreductase, partial [Fimbriimonadaceae bacterium]|nr:NAD(P)-dependent oxidoreductase [Fimbriimonadaceae bacterium]
KAAGLYGRTLGLVGMGNIGQEMVTLAKAFGMRVVACSRWMTPEVAAAMGIGYAETLDDLASRSDFVSIHVALTPQTKGMIGGAFFGKLKPGAIFVNTSRAEVVDQAALEAALREKGIMAGLDVFNDEPSGGEGSYEGSLKDNPRVYCTHHIGASTDQAQEAVAQETVRIVKEFMRTGIAPNAVSVGGGGVASHVVVVRHQNRPDAVASILAVARNADLKVLESEAIALAADSAILEFSVDQEPPAEVLARLDAGEGVLGVSTFSL